MDTPQCDCVRWSPILCADGCAAFLHMASGREVLRLARRRELPSVKFGKRVLFLRDSVISHLKAIERPAISDAELMNPGRRGKKAGA